MCLQIIVFLKLVLYKAQEAAYIEKPLQLLFFADPIWVIISVEMGGLLGVTQQMSQFARTLGSPPKTAFDLQMDMNPFSSPVVHKPSEPIFGNPKNSFRTIGNDKNHLSNENGEDMEMAETSRNLTDTPELLSAKISSPELSASCWNSRSPTIIHGQLDKLNGSTHALHSISEEICTEPTNADTNFLTSNSSYDLAARQATPCNSPNHLLELERSFNSPDAPSPIRPTTQNMVFQVCILCSTKRTSAVLSNFFVSAHRFNVWEQRKAAKV